MSEAICIGKTIIGQTHSIFFHMIHCECVQSNTELLLYGLLFDYSKYLNVGWSSGIR